MVRLKYFKYIVYINILITSWSKAKPVKICFIWLCDEGTTGRTKTINDSRKRTCLMLIVKNSAHV